MAEDLWAALAGPFVEDAYRSVKGYVRTVVLHRHLQRHLPRPPAAVLDVGGGAGHQSLPLARAGYDVTILDPSAAMLAKARARISAEPEDVQARVRLIEAPGERADEATGGRRFAAVLCHGVLMYLSDPEPVVAALCRSADHGGIVSVLALNARTLAIRPALERRWDDALAAFDATSETGVLGTDTRGDTVEGLSVLLGRHGAEPQAWYGGWLFADWLDLPPETTDLAAAARVEFEASVRDPYRQLSRVFHLIARRPADPEGTLRTARLVLAPMPLELMRAVVAEDRSTVARLLGAGFPDEWGADEWFWLPRWLSEVDRDPTLLPWGPHLLLQMGQDGSRTVVGEAGFHGRPDPDGVAEFGYMTVREHRRRGYAEEAVRALLGWGQRQEGVRTFRATVDPANDASIGLLRKLAFAQVGRRIHPERGEELVFERAASQAR